MAEEALLRWPHQASAPAVSDTDAGPAVDPAREDVAAAAPSGAAPTTDAPRAASAWAGRLVAAAAGAGLVLVGLALRDSSPMRRPAWPGAEPPGWRRRIAAWLRGER